MSVDQNKEYVTVGGRDERRVKIAVVFEWNGERYVVRTSRFSNTTLRAAVPEHVFLSNFEEAPEVPEEKTIRWTFAKEGEEYLSESDGVFKPAAFDHQVKRWVVV